MIHCYKLGGHNIVIDVGSGAIHSVDDASFDAILSCNDSRVDDSRVDAERVDAGRDDAERVDDSRIVAGRTPAPDIPDCVRELIGQGKLFAPDDFSKLMEDAHPDADQIPVKALCLNVSHVCNMECEYCFAVFKREKAAFADEDEAERKVEASLEPLLMPLDTAKKAIDFLVENSKTQRTLDIDFFGGEPLLNWQVVKETVAYARAVEKSADKKIRFTLTTNGLAIDDDVIAFTNREMCNVVLSLDGRPEVHDKMRRIPGGEGTYERVLPNIRRLATARRKKGYYIRGTFTRENMDFSNDILHIADLGFGEISLEPAVPKGSPSARNVAPNPFTERDLPELFRQYDTLAIELKRRKTNAKYVRPSDIPEKEKPFNFYHYNLDLEHGPCIYKRIKGCGVGTSYLAVAPSGELYPCHRFVGDVAFRLGDVHRGVTNKKLRGEFSRISIFSRSECKSCWAKYYCSGGCPASAYHATGNINGVYKLGCELLKKRIENAIMLQF